VHDYIYISGEDKERGGESDWIFITLNQGKEEGRGGKTAGVGER